MKKILCIFLMFTLVCSIFAGCDKKTTAVNLMENIRAKRLYDEDEIFNRKSWEISSFLCVKIIKKN